MNVENKLNINEIIPFLFILLLILFFFVNKIYLQKAARELINQKIIVLRSTSKVKGLCISIKSNYYNL